MNPIKQHFKAALGQKTSESLWAAVWMTVIAMSMSVPAVAWGAPLFGAWVGQAQIGEKLRVNLTVSGLDAEGQTQLKTTCMEAWAEAERYDSSSIQTRVPLNLEYGRTVDRGGLITISSRKAMRDPVVRVHLVSNCPLITFAQVWDLQLDFQTSSDSDLTQGSDLAIAQGGQIASVSSAAFNLSNSSALAASFKKPALITESVTKWAQRAPKAVHQVPNESAQHTRKIEKPALEPIEAIPSLSSPDLALAQTRTHIEPATRVGQVENVVLNQPSSSERPIPIKPTTESWALDPSLSSGGTNLLPFVLFAGVSLLMIAFGVWWGQKHSVLEAYSTANTHGVSLGKRFGIWRKWRNSLLRPRSLEVNASAASEFTSDSQSGGTDHMWVETQGTSALNEMEAAMPAVEQKSNHPEIFNKQLFESFLGTNPGMNESLNTSLPSPNQVIKAPQDESKSLMFKVYASQSRSIAPWRLAEQYLGLIPSRVDSENLEDEVVHTRIKCEMGLIELAYLNAHQSVVLYDIQIEEMLKMLDPSLHHQSAAQGNRAPSDLIKDFVRAKWCEFSSIQEVDLFTESLRMMHESSYCQKLCMAHPSWLELMNNLEVS